MASSIVVMGVSGSGKSTVGAALARRLAVPFADGDDFHPSANIVKMAAGHPLTDADRYTWLDAIGQWLAEHCEDGGVMACSALKRTYRDRLRKYCPTMSVLYLSGSQRAIASRHAARHGHFMPVELLASQFATLEPLEADERGVEVNVDRSVESIVDTYVARLAAIGHQLCTDDWPPPP